MVPFIFCSSHQAPLMLSSAVDLLFVLTCPIRYRAIRTLPYVTGLCIPAGIYSLVVIVFGWIMVNDDLLEFCNPLVGTHPLVLSWWIMTNIAINICILITYMIALAVLKSKAVYSEYHGVTRRLSNYYVCFWRSSDYRRAFKEQLNILLCKRVLLDGTQPNQYQSVCNRRQLI
ncbi:hypothetical protein ANCCEY_09719 [Ancylostoma ceylanicum]|uniref:G-protein coupled receptors family 1 profile domain-containing protein n=1 Tax=Ancylostoma ceylanicum TaxID=53326 RepID=A0A0D6LGI0_9BILA|nr:hypothetical protein ANCCEY_09719 [Ancylostoma ceylanicum]